MNLALNFAVFQLGWFSSVLGGANQLPWMGPLAVIVAVFIHLSRAERPQAELYLILSCGLIGAFFDSALVAAGWIVYPSGVFLESAAPYWIIGMWMLFATTLNVSMNWMRARPLLAAAMGFVAGPLSYLAGEKLGGLVFINELAALTALAIGWAVMMPLLMQLATRFNGISVVRNSQEMSMQETPL